MMTTAGKCRPTRYVQASALVRPDDLSLAPELLLRLFAGVTEGERDTAVQALEELREFAVRLDCSELASCCGTTLDAPVPPELSVLVTRLPALLRVWERTQDLLVSRAVAQRSGRQAAMRHECG